MRNFARRKGEIILNTELLYGYDDAFIIHLLEPVESMNRLTITVDH